MIYLDYHATSPCDPAVVSAMLPYFTDHCGNPQSRENALGREAARLVHVAKSSIAAFIDVSPESLILTSGATESNNLALRGTTPAPGRNEIIVSALEHPSVLNAAYATGLAIKIIPATPDGFIMPDALAPLLTDRTHIVSVMAANHEIGTIQPVAALATLAHRAGALFHCDATQAAGRMPLPAITASCDLLSLSGHKLYGPQGIGILYARAQPPLPLAPLLRGGGTSVRPGTLSLALTVGLGVACVIAHKNLKVEAARLQNLGAQLLTSLRAALPDMLLNGAEHPRLPGSFNIRLPGVEAEALLLALADDLCLSTGAACVSATRQPSPVLKAIGLTDTEIASSLRFSLGRQTKDSDIGIIVDKLVRAVQAQRLEHAA